MNQSVLAFVVVPLADASALDHSRNSAAMLDFDCHSHLCVTNAVLNDSMVVAVRHLAQGHSSLECDSCLVERLLANHLADMRPEIALDLALADLRIDLEHLVDQLLLKEKKIVV